MDFINTMAEGWMFPLAMHVFEFSLFIALIWLADTVFHLNTKIRYWLWLLAMLKIFIPPVLQMPQQAQVAQQGLYLLTPISATSAFVKQEFILSTPGWIALLWLLSILGFTIVFWMKNRILQHQLSEAIPLQLSELKSTQLNSINNLRLFASDNLQTPLLTGLFRPSLYLPAGYNSWPPVQLESVLQHEIAHLKHRDLWAVAGQMAALIFFGLNPLVWLMHRRLLHLRELRCDEYAIRETGIHPTEYSRFLYDILKKQQKPTAALASGIYFAEDSQAIFKRFSHIFEISKKGVQKMRWWHYLVVITVCAAILPLSWQCSNKNLLVTPENSELKKVKNFVEFDKAPAPVGGFKTIQENLKYPELARKAGIEGRVILNVLVGVDGKVKETQILKNIADGNNGCAEAAVAAVEATEWTPAEQKGKPVQVWVGIPVIFRLSGEKQNDSDDILIMKTKKSKKFVEFDKAPAPVGGFAAIQENLTYPEIARKAGLEGRVILNVLVGIDGKVKDTQILKNLADGNNGCAEAAINAVRAVNWRPAEQKGKPVEVWVAIPVIFRLK
ncbi:MAG: M56 family peptidase [Calditrichaeota bacterium]|nr:MAG: M56 family peptidase [Calditrichota bacterium]